MTTQSFGLIRATTTVHSAADAVVKISKKVSSHVEQKMKFGVQVFFLVLLFSPIAQAGCAGVACSDVIVDELYVNANGDIYVATSGNEQTLSCSAVSEMYVTLKKSDGNSKEIYSALLASQRAGKSVEIRVAENSSGCNILYIRSKP